jgi:hypothetical protein
VAERPNARDCKSLKPGVQIPPVAPDPKVLLKNNTFFWLTKKAPFAIIENKINEK